MVVEPAGESLGQGGVPTVDHNRFRPVATAAPTTARAASVA
jgi:hypothetical protein